MNQIEQLRESLSHCPKCGGFPNSGFIDRRIDGTLALRVACVRHEMAVELDDIDDLTPLLAAAEKLLNAESVTMCDVHKAQISREGECWRRQYWGHEGWEGCRVVKAKLMIEDR